VQVRLIVAKLDVRDADVGKAEFLAPAPDVID
jgi:hypothetical protein